MSDHPFEWSHTLTNQALGYLGQNFQGLLEQASEGRPPLEGQDSFYAQVAYALSPDKLGVAMIFNRTPYANPEVFREMFAGALQRGWLEQAGEGAFLPSDQAVSYVEAVLDAMDAAFENVESLPVDKTARLTELVEKVVKAATADNAVAPKPALTISNKFTEKSAGRSAIFQLRRQLISLLSWRDDAHVAAWSQREVPGYVWETFAFVCDEQGHTAASLAETLNYRNHSESDYALALADLEKRGWIRLVEDGGKATEEGLALRAETETLTNALYNAPFAALSSAEQEELHSLLEELVAVLKPEEAPAD